MWKSITWLLSTRDSRILARLTQFWGSPTGVASTTRELAWPAPGPADSSAADVQAASATASATTRAAEIGRAHVLTPVTNAHLVCRLLLAIIILFFFLLFSFF